MPAPVTNLRHESSRRGFFHYMPHLLPPVFLNIEYSRAFVREYPMCAQFKNIVLPYPSLDPAIINGQVQRHKKHPAVQQQGAGGGAVLLDNRLDPASNSGNLPSRYDRSLLMFYRGGNHGECMAVRQGLVRLMGSLLGKSKSKDKDKQGGALWAGSKHKVGYLNAVFCPVPVGDSPSSKRMYDALHVGCVPVVLSDDLVWAFSPATGGSLLPHSFSLALPQKVVR
jgi:hypothetical protein